MLILDICVFVCICIHNLELKVYINRRMNPFPKKVKFQKFIYCINKVHQYTFWSPPKFHTEFLHFLISARPSLPPLPQQCTYQQLLTHFLAAGPHRIPIES